MLIQLSDTIRREVETTVRTHLSQSRIVDVYATAEDIRRRHADEDVVFEHIAASVAQLASQCGCVVEFGRRRGDTSAAALA